MNQRIKQAEVLWGCGIGRALGYQSLETYTASIPEVPDGLTEDDERFPSLVLVDARLPAGQARDLAIGVECRDDEDVRGKFFKDVGSCKTRDEKVYWIRCQDGRRYQGKSVQDCRKEFATRNDETGLTLHEGLAFAVQYGNWLLYDWAMDVTETVDETSPEDTLSLNGFGLLINLYTVKVGVGNKCSGSGSKRV